MKAVSRRTLEKRERRSLDSALDRYGARVVKAARKRLEQGMAHAELEAWRWYHRAMASSDPYDVIVKFYALKLLDDPKMLRRIARVARR